MEEFHFDLQHIHTHPMKVAGGGSPNAKILKEKCEQHKNNTRFYYYDSHIYNFFRNRFTD